MAERDIHTPPPDRTDDTRARHAAQHPLGTATTPQPRRARSGSLGWGIPAAAVLVVLAVLLIWVF